MLDLLVVVIMSNDMDVKLATITDNTIYLLDLIRPLSPSYWTLHIKSVMALARDQGVIE